MFLTLSFLLGLVVGSFLNVIIIRGERSERITGRSHCKHCGKTLSFYELVPVLSFVLQKGRCRSCGAALLWQYPLVELGTAILFIFAAVFIFPPSFYPFDLVFLFTLIRWLLALAVLSSSVVIFVSDIRFRIIPNGAVLVFLFSGAAFRIMPSVLDASRSLFPALHLPTLLLWDLGSALAIALLLAGVWFVTKGRGMGLGDAKLIFATSLLLGFPESIAAAVLSFWLGALAGITMVLVGLKSIRDQIPFGPYILLGTAFAFFSGEYFLKFLGL